MPHMATSRLCYSFMGYPSFSSRHCPHGFLLPLAAEDPIKQLCLFPVAEQSALSSLSLSCVPAGIHRVGKWENLLLKMRDIANCPGDIFS